MRRVAVTGFGVVSPIGLGAPAFFAALREGRSGVARITRFDCSTFTAQLAAEVKEPLDLPDAVVPFAAVEPKIGFSYAACVQALQGAGITRFDEKTLVHLGTMRYTLEVEQMFRDRPLDVADLVGRCLSGETPALQIPVDTAGRLLCGVYGAPGRLLTNCSACAAGAQAIGNGFRGVRAGLWDVAVCGGFHTMIDPLGVASFQMLGAVTTEVGLGARACRPFDASRSGTILGEGAGVLVLEPLEKARAEGKRVLAEVCGYGSSLDAHGLSAPDPEGRGVENAMRRCLEDAGATPSHIGHINTHGTATLLNDEVEAGAIRRVFEGCWQEIPVSATKSLTGHLMAAAGPVEAGACIAVLTEGWMPHNPSLAKVGRGCELRHVVGGPEPFTGEYVLTTSLGFGGQNAALVLRRGG